MNHPGTTKQTLADVPTPTPFGARTPVGMEPEQEAQARAAAAGPQAAPPLRVLLFTQHFWPESFRINDVARDLQAAGCELTVLTGQPNYPGGRVFEGYRAWRRGHAVEQGLDVVRVPLVPRGGGGALRLVMNYLSFMGSAAIFGTWALRGRPFDVVFVYATSPLLQALPAIALARLKGCAIVTWVQDLWPQSLQTTGHVRNPKLLAAVAAVVRFIYRHQTRVLVPSPAFVGEVRQLAPATLPIHTHANPGDHTPGFGETPALVLDDDKFNVVFAGNLGAAQGLEVLIDTAQQALADADLRDVRFVLIGSGSRSDWLAQQVAQRGLVNVLMPGRFQPAQMSAILEQAQALLVSLNAGPAMDLTIPSKLQTYLGCGRPIIAALAGAGAQVVREAHAGIVCPPGDAAALLAAVRTLRGMTREARDAMGAHARQYYRQHYSSARLTPRLIAHLREAAAAVR